MTTNTATAKTLRNELKTLGINVKTTVKKADLVDMLQNAEKIIDWTTVDGMTIHNAPADEPTTETADERAKRKAEKEAERAKRKAARDAKYATSRELGEERKAKRKAAGKTDTIEIVKAFLENVGATYTVAPSGDGINVKNTAGKTYMKIWRRAKFVRLYINHELKDEVPANLVERVAPSTTPGNMDVSMYVPTENIKTVLEALF